uniref:Ig-like domain-containing protein n=1 Tax=Ficedula albicollis TaxID=59894 RepID=U3JDW6_FICAL
SRCGPAPGALAGHHPGHGRFPGEARCGCGCGGPGAPGARDSALGPRSRPARLLRSPSAGLWAQPRLQEAGGGLRAPGDSVTLSCHGSGFTFENHYVRWYRQAHGGRLEWVSYISSGTGRAQGYGAAVEGRATISRDNSRSEAYLSLQSLQAQDSARYFCAIPREQEMQMSFNTNLPGSGRDCVRCQETVTGQVALEQHPREVTVREGDPGTFQCSMEGGSKNSYVMYWYRQGPRGSLKWIYMEGDYYVEGFQDHFKGR